MREREELIDSLSRRIRTYMDGDDPAPALAPAALDEAERLHELTVEHGPDPDACYYIGWLLYVRGRILNLAGSTGYDFSASILMLAPSYVAGRSDLPSGLLPHLAGVTVPPAHELLLQAEQDPVNGALLDSVVELWNRIATDLPPDHPHSSFAMVSLARAFRLRYERSGSPRDLDSGIGWARRAADNPPDDPSIAADSLSELAKNLHLRFQADGARHDLDEAIDRLRAAAQQTPAREINRSTRFGNLASSIRDRIRLGGEVAGDVTEAESAAREALALIPTTHPLRAKLLFDMAQTLLIGFENSENPVALDEIITTLEQAFSVSPDSEQRLTVYLPHLVTVRLIRQSLADGFVSAAQAAETCALLNPESADSRPVFAQRLFLLGKLTYALQVAAGTHTPDLVLAPSFLDAARELAELLDEDVPDQTARLLLADYHSARVAALPTKHASDDVEAVLRFYTRCFIDGMSEFPDYALPEIAVRAAEASVTRLAKALHPDAAPEALDDVVKLLQRVVEHFPAHDERLPRLQGNLALALVRRHVVRNNLADLDHAIAAAASAIDGTRHDDALRSTFSNTAGEAYHLRFLANDSTDTLTDDLEQAIHAFQEVCDLAPGGELESRARLALGSLLLVRYDAQGKDPDLDRALTVLGTLRENDLTPRGRAGFQSQLGAGMMRRFERYGAQQDLREAAAHARLGVDLLPADDPLLSACQSQLGVILRMTFEHGGPRHVLDEAVDLARASVNGPIPLPKDRVTCHSNLALALWARFEQDGDTRDLDQAAVAAQAAVDASAGWSHRYGYALHHSTLAGVLHARFLRTKDVADVDRAIAALESVVEALPVGHHEAPPASRTA